MDPVEVSGSDPRHTGTYRCGYTNQSLEHLDTWIHLYVKGKIMDPMEPNTLCLNLSPHIHQSFIKTRSWLMSDVMFIKAEID